ncbi:acyl-CoA dehydrogenase family protein [Streptomyces sp. NPDC054933]
MDAAFTEEQDEIRRTLRELLHKRCGPDDVKAACRTPAGYDEVLWRQLATRLGLPGLALPPRYGGVGCGPTELALACEETGRALLPAPLLASCVLVAPLIAELGSEQQRAGYLPGIAAGELTAALAVPEPLSTVLALTGPNDGAWSGGGRAGGVQARQAEDGWRLYGQADQVLDGHSAGLLLVAAHTGGYVRSRTRLFVVEPTGPGVSGLTRTRLTSLDETRPQARVELRDVAAVPLGGDAAQTPAELTAALLRTGGLAAAVLAAQAVGAADFALSSTVEYVRVREQFGRPVGSFQAVKHRLADGYVRVQAARSAAYYAAWAVGRGGPGDGNGDDGIGVAGPLALAQALEALNHVAGESIQLHGGVGFTWEHHAHLYFKRAAADELIFGPVHRLRAHAAQRAGLFAGRVLEGAVA